MKNYYLIMLLYISFLSVSSQNTSQRIIANNEGLYIGSYGQIDMNLKSEEGIHHNAKLDVHR